MALPDMVPRTASSESRRSATSGRRAVRLLERVGDRLTRGNYFLFVLKMPQFFSQYSMNLTLKRTLNSYKITSEMSSRELSSADVPRLKQLFHDYTEIIGEFIASTTRSAVARGPSTGFRHSRRSFLTS
jgi:hypothetical protein